MQNIWSWPWPKVKPLMNLINVTHNCVNGDVGAHVLLFLICMKQHPIIRLLAYMHSNSKRACYHKFVLTCLKDGAGRLVLGLLSNVVISTKIDNLFCSLGYEQCLVSHILYKFWANFNALVTLTIMALNIFIHVLTV